MAVTPARTACSKVRPLARRSRVSLTKGSAVSCETGRRKARGMRSRMMRSASASGVDEITL